MSITADGWFDWAIRDPGPPERQNGGRNTLKIFVPHSAEGYWPHLRTVLWGDRGSSWFASNLRDGRFIQHYSIYAQTWTSGSGYPNNNGLAWENEGVQGEPFTPAQTENCIRVIREVSALTGMTAWRRPVNSLDKDAQLYEHNECTRWGSLPTACPSHRVPWPRIIAGLEGDMAITLAACGDSPTGFRLYALGSDTPKWITDPKAAADLQAAFGQPKGLSWAALKALGA